jgi:PAS domain-containing protein
MRKVHRLAFKLGIAFGLLITLLLGVGWLGLRWMSRMDASFENTLQDEWAHVKFSQEALLYSSSNFRIVTEIMVTENEDEINSLRQTMAENSKRISLQLAKIKAFGIAPGREQELIDAMEAARAPYLASRNHALALMDEHKSAEAKQVIANETIPDLMAYHDAWRAFLQLEMDQYDQGAARIHSRYSHAHKLFLLLILSAALLAFGIAVPVTIGMTRAIARREKAEKELSQLNLDLEQRIASRTRELSSVNAGLAQEVAERTRAEEASRQANERVRLLLDSTAEAIYGVDRDGACTFCNAACLRMLGYSKAEDLLGKDLHNLIHHTRPGGSPYPV